jgi:hypothetical protein
MKKTPTGLAAKKERDKGKAKSQMPPPLAKRTVVDNRGKVN